MASLTEAFPREAPTILHRLRHWVETAPGSPCLLDGETALVLDYEQFDELTNRCARQLMAHGLQPGQRVALYSGNALLSALVMFGAWKAGAVYCPVNPQLRGDLLAYTLQDLGPVSLVSDFDLLVEVHAALDKLSARPTVVVNADVTIARPGEQVDGIEQRPDCEGVIPLRCFNSTDSAPLSIVSGAYDVASIIYTSGTTGRPKGVVQRHAWLHALCATQAVWTHADDVIHCDLPMHHIGGAFSLFARGIWAGASVALWDRFSAGLYWQRIGHSGASIALLIDVMADWLLENPETVEDRNNSLAKVHLQPLTDKHSRLSQRFGIDYVIAGYGSSEVGNALLGFVDAYGHQQGTPPALWRGYAKHHLAQRLEEEFGPGVLMPATGLAVSGYMGVASGFYEIALDGHVGVEDTSPNRGQLLLRPVLPEVLFAGYLNRPAESQDAIRDGAYLAPDFASVDQQHRYFYCGRREGFLRVRGENVSAAVIEQVLDAHPGVVRSAVIGLPSRQGGEDELAAFVQPVEGCCPRAEELRAWSEKRLPGYMVPGKVFLLDELPLTDTMKIDRGSLRVQGLAAVDSLIPEVVVGITDR